MEASASLCFMVGSRKYGSGDNSNGARFSLKNCLYTVWLSCGLLGLPGDVRDLRWPHLVLLDLVKQRSIADLEQAGRGFAIPSGLVQGARDRALLCFFLYNPNQRFQARWF